MLEGNEFLYSRLPAAQRPDGLSDGEFFKKLRGAFGTSEEWERYKAEQAKALGFAPPTPKE